LIRQSIAVNPAGMLQASLPVTTHLFTENKPAEKTSNPRQLEQG